jgi:hypothetical protein
MHGQKVIIDFHFQGVRNFLRVVHERNFFRAAVVLTVKVFRFVFVSPTRGCRNVLYTHDQGSVCGPTGCAKL